MVESVWHQRRATVLWDGLGKTVNQVTQIQCDDIYRLFEHILILHSCAGIAETSFTTVYDLIMQRNWYNG